MLNKSTDRIISTTFPALIAATGIVVAQLHGAPFWVALLGSVPLGWVVSLFWESMSVWLWWRGDRGFRYRLAKWTATAALLGGMIAQGAGPLLLEGERGAVAAAGVRREEGVQEKLLEAMVDQGRKGILPSIDKSLEAARGLDKVRLRGLTPRAGKLPYPPAWLPALAWAPVAAFPALYALALLALATVARAWREPHERRESPTNPGANSPTNPGANSPPGISRKPAPEQDSPPGSPPDSPPPTAKRIVAEFAHRHDLKYQSQVAEKIGVAPSTLSEFVNGKAGPEQRAEIINKLGN